MYMYIYIHTHTHIDREIGKEKYHAFTNIKNSGISILKQ